MIIVRTLPLENGNKVNFTSGPTWPYWTVSFERGGVPDSLRGKYTDFETAKLAVKTYIEQRQAKNRTRFVEDGKE